MEIHDSENRYLELYEEYTQMNIDMEELQSHLEDLGFNEDAQDEEAEVKSKSKIKIPGKKKVLKILKKTRK